MVVIPKTTAVIKGNLIFSYLIYSPAFTIKRKNLKKPLFPSYPGGVE
ncbi:hypothetical protein DOT_4701 [Desulfosporosinus sp. OT]|nr:hypothetical protein DOT_4701 [Desulfosporosinus sp. OT]